MVRNKETNMATKNPNPKVYVFLNEWEDRHGERGSNVKVFATRKAANAYFAADIKTYLENYDALTSDGTVDPETINSLCPGDTGLDDGELTLAELQKSATKAGWLEINVDSDGTNASWSVSKEEVL